MAQSNQQSFAALGDVAVKVSKPRSSSISNYNILHSGYLLKQGGGTTLLSRKNWKQRFFVLTSSGELIYSASEDDYHRQLFIKTLQLPGCSIHDTPKGLDISIHPPKKDRGQVDGRMSKRTSHVTNMRPITGNFVKDPEVLKDAEAMSDLDSVRIFHLRATNTDSKRKWVEKLKDACGESKGLLLKNEAIAE